MAQVSLRHVVKAYGATEVIHGIDLEIDAGEFVVSSALPAAARAPCCA
jgi:ABC-type sugar transport system ATPase subunit